VLDPRLGEAAERLSSCEGPRCLISLHSTPAYLRSDSDPEFVSQPILKWLAENRIDTAVIDHRKPRHTGRRPHSFGVQR
jgi:hypothetical protein